MAAEPQRTRPVRFGLCADVHKDIMHDADQRLRVFVEAMKRKPVDFVVQLGDFCRPYDHDRGFLNIWEELECPRYHVLGNHEVDGGFTREQVLEFWGVSRRFYSFDEGGYHFVVLDGNDTRDGAASGYPRYIAADQLEWLRDDLAATEGRTFLFSHQSLEDVQGLENGAEVRTVLEEENARAGWVKVAASFSGHHHIDYHVRLAGIHYIQVNSMSNYWMGEGYQHVRYSDAVDAEFPWIKYTAPYRDPLYAVVTVTDDALSIEGTESVFVGPAPAELGYPCGDPEGRIVPRIRSRRLDQPPPQPSPRHAP